MIMITKKKLPGFCMLLPLLAGCVFGDPSTVRIVSLELAKPSAQNSRELSANDAEVQEALKRMDSVLVANGLTRTPQSQAINSDGTLLRYESRTMRGCGISLSNNKLEVAFFEFGRRSSTESVKSVCKQLADELGRHYNLKRIKITTR